MFAIGLTAKAIDTQKARNAWACDICIEHSYLQTSLCKCLCKQRSDHRFANATLTTYYTDNPLYRGIRLFFRDNAHKRLLMQNLVVWFRAYANNTVDIEKNSSLRIALSEI